MQFSKEHDRVVAVSPLDAESVRLHKLGCQHRFCQALPVLTKDQV